MVEKAAAGRFLPQGGLGVQGSSLRASLTLIWAQAVETLVDWRLFFQIRAILCGI